MVQKYLYSPYSDGREVFLVGEVIADTGEHKGQVISCIVPQRLTPVRIVPGCHTYELDGRMINCNLSALFGADGFTRNYKKDFIEVVKRDIEHFILEPERAQKEGKNKPSMDG